MRILGYQREKTTGYTELAIRPTDGVVVEERPFVRASGRWPEAVAYDGRFGFLLRNKRLFSFRLDEREAQITQHGDINRILEQTAAAPTRNFHTWEWHVRRFGQSGRWLQHYHHNWRFKDNSYLVFDAMDPTYYLSRPRPGRVAGSPACRRPVLRSPPASAVACQSVLTALPDVIRRRARL